MINCLIVDDEPIARDIIKGYCNALPDLHIIASCENALDAKQAVLQNTIQIIFLDINMPVLDGMAFLRTLKNPPHIIFTTAYKEFAAEAFDLSACDYLVKPFSFDRFIMAIDKVAEKLNTSGVPAWLEQLPSSQDQTVFIKADGKVFKINYSDILFAEAKGNYTKIVTEDNTLLTAISFSGFELSLSPNLFIRVHRSFIINKAKITHLEGNSVFLGKHEIAIGNSYKSGFFNKLGLQ